MQPRTVSPVFVGRSRESNVLDEALQRAMAGAPQAVLVGGEAGVGKTRLAEEFAARARRAGALAVTGACVEAGADGLPFVPVATLLRALHRELGPELAAAAAGFGDELARLLPELAESEAPPVAQHGEESRVRLFELTVRLLESLAGRHTLVLTIEDLHWADRSTRELFGYLLRTFRHGRVVVLGTFRTDDIDRRHPLRPFLAEVDRLRAVRRMDLARFTETEVREQIAGIRGAAPDHRLVEEVHRRSDGNAFFVEELTCHETSGTSGAGISDSIRDLLLVRVESLPEDAHRVVRTLAQGGSRVEYGLLRAVVDLPDESLLDALRTAITANIIEADEDDTYRFRHALVREAVNDDLLPGERSRLSRAYAHWLEEQPELVPAAERVTRLAGYWYHAHDADRALPVVARAAGVARGRHAYAEQLHLLVRLTELWDQASSEVRATVRPAAGVESYPLCQCTDDELGLLDVLAAITVAARLAGEHERALSVATRGLRVLARLDHPVRSAWFWSQKSRLVRNLARGDGAEELTQARQLLDGFPVSPVHARVYTQTAEAGDLRTVSEDDLALAERAVAVAREVGDEEAEWHARVTRAGLLVAVGEGTVGLAELREVAGLAVARENVSSFARSHVNLIGLLEDMGRSAEAVTVAHEAITLAHRYGLRETESWIHRNLGQALFSLGRWQEAEQAGVAARRTGQTPVSQARAAELLALLALARGDLATAEREAALLGGEPCGAERRTRQPHGVVHVRFALAVARGRLLDARVQLREALGAAGTSGTGGGVWPLLHAAAVAEADAVGVPAAEPGRAEALAHLRDHAAALSRHYPVSVAYARAVEAELCRASGTATTDHWADVVAAFTPVSHPLPLAGARVRWAEALLAEGARDAAGAVLAQAHRTAVDLGAGSLVAEAERLAQRARLSLVDGRTVAERDPAGTAAGGGSVLTRRERDVLALVAVGRSNRQIGDELFISPKTASVHVTKILAKLEVASRGEAAALAHRLGLVDTSG